MCIRDSDNGGSVYLDGNGNKLSVATDANFAVSSDDFTLECFYYPETSVLNGFIAGYYSSTNNQRSYAVFHDATSGNLAMAFSTDGTFQSSNNTTSSITPTMMNGQWNHIALTKSGTTAKLYHNGILAATDTSAPTTLYTPTSGPFNIGTFNDSTYIEGHLSDVRFVKGTVVYSGEFTPPTGPLTTTGGTYPSTTNVDTSITASNTKLLLKGTDAHVIDKSQGNNLKLVGDAAASTTQAKFSNTASVSFDGDGDYVSVSNLGLSGDITIEGWFYQSVAQSTTYRCVIGTSTYADTNSPLRIYTYGSNYSIWLANTGGPHISGSFTANTWHHVALVRSSGTWTLYIDGTSAGTSTTSGTYDFASTVDWTIGADSANSYPFTGYAQDVRISNGKARYTSNFTVPSAPLKG